MIFDFLVTFHLYCCGRLRTDYLIVLNLISSNETDSKRKLEVSEGKSGLQMEFLFWVKIVSFRSKSTIVKILQLNKM